MTTTTQLNYRELAKQVLQGHELTKEEALALLEAPDEDLLDILHSAYEIRKHYYGNKVKLNMIINAKSGLCPEDCGYCSQSIVADTPVEKYAMLNKDSILAGAQEAINRKAGTYCIVASGRRPSENELDGVIEAIKEIRETTSLKICACLGFLSETHAGKLAEAGVHRYNHNLNTDKSNYDNICSTHTYDDRVDTVQKVKDSGMSPCSGVIMGMGESSQELVNVAFSVKALDVDSIPVNFLNSIDGTPLQGTQHLNPRHCLKAVAMFRFVNPTKEIRLSGGREINLRSLQAMGLYAANSIFVGDYLTTQGQEPTSDWGMIQDLGFEIEECAL
ncbi:biotin synthase BioB [Tumebacillus sp. ITR2]|uniref:Biotin synthase n=2 Tax=Tumebacillus amylolyticus TaxID=2801339 RepID=A0ABS1J7F5_9BACL|nr:biotin synthase BioB [Tumebacillus amylolyticus]MBL0386152.1 biotin synthase BioB [Tumebacillus amylolyticus]